MRSVGLLAFVAGVQSFSFPHWLQRTQLVVGHYRAGHRPCFGYHSLLSTVPSDYFSVRYKDFSLIHSKESLKHNTFLILFLKT